MTCGDWRTASELQVKPTQFAYVDAVTHFARALGAARSGKPETAKADVAKLAELSTRLREAKDPYWSEVLTSSARLRPHGCSMPRATTPMH